MWKYLYCIYDKVMQEHSAPFMANNDEHAKAIFDISVSQAEKSGYKSDFDLVKLCKFHTGSGQLEGYYNTVVPMMPKDPQSDLFNEE